MAQAFFLIFLCCCGSVLSEKICGNLQPKIVPCGKIPIFCPETAALSIFSTKETTTKLDQLLDQPIKSAPSISAKILRERFLSQHQCELYVVGGALRDLLNGNVKPPDLDLRSKCSFQRLLKACQIVLGPENCLRAYSKKGIIVVGSRKSKGIAVDLSIWRHHFDYWANHLFASFDSLGLIDVDGGNIVRDVCDKKIRLPSENGRLPFDAINTQRYWKLLEKGYKPIDEETKILMESKGREVAQNLPKSRLLWPFCRYVQNGNLLPFPVSDCRSKRMKRAASYPGYTCEQFQAVLGIVMSSPSETLSGVVASAFECGQECMRRAGCVSFEYHDDGETKYCKFAYVPVTDTAVFTTDASNPARKVYQKL